MIFSENVDFRMSGEQVPVFISKEVKDPKKWTAETPELYTLVLELLDKNGHPLEFITSKTGFRTSEIQLWKAFDQWGAGDDKGRGPS